MRVCRELQEQMGIFESTVSALTYSIIADRCVSDSNRFVSNRVAQFLLTQIRQMPDYAGFVFVVLTVLFDVSPLLALKPLWHAQEPTQRWHQIKAWKRLPIGMLRDLVKFYETLVVFGWYSEIYDQTPVNLDTEVSILPYRA